MEIPVTKPFIALVDEGSNIESVVSTLKEKGCTINHVLPLTGIISGNVNSDIPLQSLKVTGVKSVEEDRDISK